jgi:hypothetical protein
MIEEFVYKNKWYRFNRLVRVVQWRLISLPFSRSMIGPSISHSCWDLQFYLYYLILLIQHLLSLSLWTDWGEGEAELSHVTIMCSITYISYQAASGPPVCMQRNEALPVILMSSCCHRRASGLFSNTHSLSLTTNQNPKVVVRMQTTSACNPKE